MRDEIAPKNIMLIGPTGVGKTEIARRLAKLAGAPFVKVEASKFTEVGYVGRDVDSMVRDLVETAVSMLREEERERRAAARARERRGAPARRAAAARAAPRAPTRAGATMTSSIGAGAAPHARAAAPTTPRARTCASCCARGSSTSRWSRSTPPTRRRRSSTCSPAPGMEEMVLNLRDMMPQGARQHEAAPAVGPRGAGAS